MKPSKKPSGHGLPFKINDPEAAMAVVERGSQPVPFCGCWIWLGSLRNRYGYGGINIQGSVMLAHRVAYAAANGPIPAKAVVMHTCDTPLCVNPEHLKLGTVSNNMRDMYDKGRKSKLSLAKVRLVRDKLKVLSRKEVAENLGLDIDTIARIARGESWGNAV